jgi:hypothetical protein
MARSSDDPARRFLIKVDQNEVPRDQTGMPFRPAQWEGETFLTGRPRQEITWREVDVPPEGKRDPSRGDPLYIWINGWGLSATAEVADLSQHDGEGIPRNRRRHIQVMNVRPYDPIGAINDSNIRDLPEIVLQDIARSRGATLRYVPNDDALGIEEAVRRLTVPGIITDGSLLAPLPRVSRSSGSRGQGFRACAQERMEVEQRAMSVASELLRSQGWSVEDRSSYESYDLFCSRDDRQVYAEVKGSSRGDGQIIITYGEAEFAREHREEMLLLVVSDIEIRRNAHGGVSALGGTPHFYWEWAPEESQLRPIAYICRL